MIEQIGFFFTASGFFQQIMNEQILVAGGGNLRYKNSIFGVNIGLAFVRIAGMKGVAHFMGEGKNIVQISLIV